MQAEADEGPEFQPQCLVEQPEIWPHLVFYREAWVILSADRPFGALGGCGSIPFTAIDRFAERYGVDDLDAFDRLRSLIDAQDRIYLRDVASKAEKPGKP